MIRAVIFDVIGTTVRETKPNIILDCLQKAFARHKTEVDRHFLKQQRGKDKRVMIREVLSWQNLPADMENSIYSSFKENIRNNVTGFSENEGVGEVFSFLKKLYIKIGIGTGLERDLFNMIFDHLHWEKYEFDYTGICAETGRSRPHPDMIIEMMNKFFLKPNEVLKVGDTIADIQEGKNAGVRTAVLLSGTQEVKDLLKHSPDFVLNSLVEIKNLSIFNAAGLRR
ncbi:MAG TPA: HAD family hydrolase [Chitinophagaceae bacterium]|nr:HAD family hydrolase [Chitinophagaceae bacterium]